MDDSCDVIGFNESSDNSQQAVSVANELKDVVGRDEMLIYPATESQVVLSDVDSPSLVDTSNSFLTNVSTCSPCESVTTDGSYIPVISGQNPVINTASSQEPFALQHVTSLSPVVNSCDLSLLATCKPHTEATQLADSVVDNECSMDSGECVSLSIVDDMVSAYSAACGQDIDGPLSLATGHIAGSHSVVDNQESVGTFTVFNADVTGHTVTYYPTTFPDCNIFNELLAKSSFSSDEYDYLSMPHNNEMSEQVDSPIDSLSDVIMFDVDTMSSPRSSCSMSTTSHMSSSCLFRDACDVSDFVLHSGAELNSCVDNVDKSSIAAAVVNSSEGVVSNITIVDMCASSDAMVNARSDNSVGCAKVNSSDVDIVSGSHGDSSTGRQDNVAFVDCNDNKVTVDVDFKDGAGLTSTWVDGATSSQTIDSSVDIPVRVSNNHIFTAGTTAGIQSVGTPLTDEQTEQCDNNTESKQRRQVSVQLTTNQPLAHLQCAAGTKAQSSSPGSKVPPDASHDCLLSANKTAQTFASAETSRASMLLAAAAGDRTSKVHQVATFQDTVLLPRPRCCPVCRPTCDDPVLLHTCLRRRARRVGLNLFNRQPEVGIEYLIDKQFIERSPASVAKFLMTCKGLSKRSIGEYISNLRRPFNMLVLRHFSDSVDLTQLNIDDALRKYQSYFHLPGESQRIERLMEVFSRRYCACNASCIDEFAGGCDTVFLLAFSIVLLNTDLHSPSIRPERRMSLVDFVHNLRGLDAGLNIDRSLLTGIYTRIKTEQLQPDSDHVNKIIHVDRKITGSLKPVLALPERRLIMYCTVREVRDPGVVTTGRSKHLRGLLLFSDILLITKIVMKKKVVTTYNLRQVLSLDDMSVYVFETQLVKHGVQLRSISNNSVLFSCCAVNEYDHKQLINDLHDTIIELHETRSAESIYSHKLASTSLHGNTSSCFYGNTVLPDSILPTRQRSVTPVTSSVANSTSYPSGSHRSLDSGLVSVATSVVSSFQDVEHLDQLTHDKLNI